MKGLGVSSGIGRGKAALLLSDGHLAVPRRKLKKNEVKSELERFENALLETERELAELHSIVEKRIGPSEAAIFSAQITLARDPMLVSDVLDAVTKQRLNIEASLTDVVARAAKMIAELNDPLIQERSADIRDVGRRILTVLMREHSGQSVIVPEGSVVVATELLPSVTAHLQFQGVKALVTELGSKTSHAAILARSMNIPYVVGVEGAASKIRHGDDLIVDGTSGEVIINPNTSLDQYYGKLEAKLEIRQEALQEFSSLSSTTRDGVLVQLSANVAKLEEVESALQCGSDGVGLCRTEFLFMGQDKFPTEEEQFQFYKGMAEIAKPYGVVIRVLDLGADKMLPYFPFPAGSSSPLGMRGTRLLLRYPEILETQLRAILRASYFGHLEILFPMIVDEAEMTECRKIVRDMENALRTEGYKFKKNIPVGAMIEVPAAALLARNIMRQADFISVGTNDLIQFLLTADRTVQDMTPYYETLHPSVLHTISRLVHDAKKAEKTLTVCGEMAADPMCTTLLLGLGIRRLSVVSGKLLEVRREIRSTDLQSANRLARKCLNAKTAKEISGEILKLKSAGAIMR